MAQITRETGTSVGPKVNLASQESGQHMGSCPREKGLANIGEDCKFEGLHATRGSGPQL